MKELIENERQFSRRVRRAAIAAWVVTCVTLPQTGLLIVLERASDDGNPGLQLAAALLGSVGLLSLILALLTTIAWLFRSRTPTLAAIEMRLAALEDLIIAGR